MIHENDIVSTRPGEARAPSRPLLTTVNHVALAAFIQHGHAHPSSSRRCCCVTCHHLPLGSRACTAFFPATSQPKQAHANVHQHDP
jgi:hypothetical protein